MRQKEGVGYIVIDRARTFDYTLLLSGNGGEEQLAITESTMSRDAVHVVVVQATVNAPVVIADTVPPGRLRFEDLEAYLVNRIITWSKQQELPGSLIKFVRDWCDSEPDGHWRKEDEG
jgi:hypothetical protein